MPKDVGIRSGDTLAFEPGRGVARLSLWNCQGDAALAEAQLPDDLQGRAADSSVGAVFGNFVKADDSEIGSSGSHHLRDVVVSQVQYLQREIGGLGQKLPFTFIDLDADVAQKRHTVFIQPAFGLNGDTQ